MAETNTKYMMLCKIYFELILIRIIILQKGFKKRPPFAEALSTLVNLEPSLVNLTKEMQLNVKFKERLTSLEMQIKQVCVLCFYWKLLPA